MTPGNTSRPLSTDSATEGPILAGNRSSGVAASLELVTRGDCGRVRHPLKREALGAKKRRACLNAPSCDTPAQREARRPAVNLQGGEGRTGPQRQEWSAAGVQPKPGCALCAKMNATVTIPEIIVEGETG